MLVGHQQVGLAHGRRLRDNLNAHSASRASVEVMTCVRFESHVSKLIAFGPTTLVWATELTVFEAQSVKASSFLMFTNYFFCFLR